MSINKKKAFTLTELLVVVVIIGVLSAVILPKFNKVVETRKTTEAEELMAAVRTEQEYRCAMDKPYIGDIANLSQIIPQAETKNFTYQLETNGILASSRSKSYDLKMPSYADGRFCCVGKACKELNKDYPKCDDLIAQPDYKVATECTADIPLEQPLPNPDPTVSCKEEEKVLRQQCAQGCEWQTRNVAGCENGNWIYTDWDKSKCRDASTEIALCDSDSGYTGVQTRTEVCDPETGRWTFDGVDYNTEKCDLLCDVSNPNIYEEKHHCEEPQGNVPLGSYEEVPGEGFVEIGSMTEGTWDMNKCKCKCPTGSHLDGDGQCVRNCNRGSSPEIDGVINQCESDGAVWNAESCSCECLEGQQRGPDNQCKDVYHHKPVLLDTFVVHGVKDVITAGGEVAGVTWTKTYYDATETKEPSDTTPGGWHMYYEQDSEIPGGSHQFDLDCSTHVYTTAHRIELGETCILPDLFCSTHCSKWEETCDATCYNPKTITPETESDGAYVRTRKERRCSQCGDLSTWAEWTFKMGGIKVSAKECVAAYNVVSKHAKFYKCEGKKVERDRF